MSSFIRKHTRTTLLAATAVLFLILYGRFLFGDAVYMYSDIGSDSLSSSYPIITMLSRLYETKTFNYYTLWDGLGADTTATFLQYLNPLKMLILLFGRDNFPMGILLVAFITHMLTALFAFGFFRRLVKNDYAALLPSLAWTFSSYMVVWGQNYSYSQCILMFTLVMFLLQGYLSGGNRRWALGLVLAYALFLISNYYFFYMAAAFSALYVILYTMFAGEEHRFTLTFKRLFILLATGIGALLTGCVSVLPIVLSFTGSARSGDTTSQNLGDLIRLFDIRTYITFAARYFSANLVGVGNSYTGSVNYYEAALLSTSVLCTFAVIYLFFRKGSFLKTLFSLIITAAVMVTPLVGYLLTFNVQAQRFSFMICFAECIAIAFMMRDLDDRVRKGPLVISCILTPVITIGLLALFYLTRDRYGFAIRERTLVITAGFILLFTVLLFMHLGDRTRPRLRGFMCAVLCLELVFANIPSLYERDYLSKDAFNTGFYNDGTQNASSKIRSEDESLYRISTSDTYDMANEGLVDGHNAVTVYSNTNAASIISLTNAAGVYQKSRNFFIVGYPQYYLYTLLSGKYLVTDEPNFAADSLEESLFKEIDDSGTNRIFENVNALPFGYVYDKELDGEEFSSLDGIDRMRALTTGYVRTDEIKPVTVDNVSSKNTAAAAFDKTETVADLMEKITSPNEVDLKENKDKSLTINARGEDPYFLYDLSKVKKGGKDIIQYLTLSIDPDSVDGESQIQIFLTTGEHPELSPELSYIYYLSKDYPQLNVLLPDNVMDIRVDLTTGSELVFREMKVTSVKNAASDFRKLAATDISDIQFRDDTYSATVNTKEKGSLLCVPLIYSKNWTALVNGTEAEVLNINGGLTGIVLEQGENRVAISYEIPHFKIGVYVSLASLVIILLLMIIPLPHKKKNSDVII